MNGATNGATNGADVAAAYKKAGDGWLYLVAIQFLTLLTQFRITT